MLTKVDTNFDVLWLSGVDNIRRVTTAAAREVCTWKTSPVGILIINNRDRVFGVQVVSFPSSRNVGACILVIGRPVLVADGSRGRRRKELPA
jgi:hypothetical protein